MAPWKFRLRFEASGLPPLINLQSGLRQQWTGSQLIPSGVTCGAVPTKACFFNTSTKSHFCCGETCEAQEPLIASKRVSRKSISVLGHTWLSFIKTNFKHFGIGETPVLDISNFQNCQVSPKNQWLFDFPQCVCGPWVMYQKNWVFRVFWERRLGAFKNRDDIRK